MKVMEMYYNTLLENLGYFEEIISNIEDIEKLDEDNIDNLLEIQLRISKEIFVINKLKENTSKYENLNELGLLISQMSRILDLKYIDYNFKIFVYLINKINELLDNPIEDIIDNEYTSDKFYLTKAKKEELNTRSIYFSPKENNIIVVLSFEEQGTDLKEFQQVISEITSLELLIDILHKLDLKNELEGLTYIFTSINYKDKESIFSYINMIQIYLGKIIHESKKSIYEIKLKNENNFELIDQYVQFSDIFYILSEFNEEKNILNKYLKVYQVIENFMFRIPLCELIDDTKKMFTIREFNRLYSNIESNEKDALKKFFKKSLLETDSNGVILIKIVKDYIDDFKSNNTSKLEDIRLFLTNKGFLSNNELSNIKNLNDIETKTSLQNNLISVISNFIYSLRNSIVHNKATEFHLTNNNLEDSIRSLIDELVIPILIEIIFFLIMNNSQVITYNARELKLY